VATLGRGRRQLTSLLWKASIDDEVNAEFAFHVDMRTRELVARGMDPVAARAAAEARFGDMRAVTETCRSIGIDREKSMERSEYLAELSHDIRFAIRQLWHARAFTVVAVLTLSLGIGATTAIFSAVESVVLRAFPYPRTSDLVFSFTRFPFGDGDVSVGDFVDWQQRSTSFLSFAAFNLHGRTIVNGQSSERILGADASANTFATLGVPPQLGRVFTAADDQRGNTSVVVLSDGFWRRAFAGDRGVLGRTLTLDGRPFTVIGVMPRNFDPTDSHEKLWTPLETTPAQRAEHDNHFLTVVGRLKPGTSLAAAQREMDAIAKRMADELPLTNATSGVRLAALDRTIVGDYRAKLFVLLGAVGCVLLIACGNVANLLLARGAARSKELAIRAAIGAGRSRIMRQLLTESLVLAGLSTAVGICLAWIAIRVLVRAAPSSIPRLASTHIDTGVLLFALALAVLSSLIFGLVPALRAAGSNLQGTLREGGKTSIAAARDRTRGLLVCAEVAIALTLLIGAGLLIRSAIYLNELNPGFDPRGLMSGLVAMRQSPDKNAYIANEQTFSAILADLRARPGVESAALSSQVPTGPGGSSNGLIPEGKAQIIKNVINSKLRLVTPGYLGTMRIPLLEGRGFSSADMRGGLRVMIVSAALAKAAWPNADPIGKRISCCDGTADSPSWKTIIGVASDVHSGGPTQDVGPEFYLPLAQAPIESWTWIQRTMTLVARARNGDAVSLAPLLRASVRDVDPTLPLYSMSTMDARLSASMADSRFHLMLLATLGVIGMLLAAAGIYSVIAYFVTLRTHEIGVRMALGATTGNVLRLLTWQGLRPVIAGVALGGALSLAATRLLAGSLYGVHATDPETFVVVIALVLLVALCATLLPARRATSVDPTTALYG
jgi:putative ABC transport system permease protein